MGTIVAMPAPPPKTITSQTLALTHKLNVTIATSAAATVAVIGPAIHPLPCGCTNFFYNIGITFTGIIIAGWPS